MKDEHGYSIVVGCLVKVNPPNGGKAWKGWVEDVDESAGLLGVVCASRGGMRRPVRAETAKVLRPSTFDKARKKGVENMTHDASTRLRRR